MANLPANPDYLNYGRVVSRAAAQTALTLTPTAQTTTNSYADLVGSKIDTSLSGFQNLFVQVSNTGANSITVKLVSSVDDVNYLDVTAYDNTGTVQGAVGVAIAAAAKGYLVIGPTLKGGPPQARYWKLQIQATVGGSQGQATATIFAK